MIDAILHLLYDFGITWVAAAPNCPKCGGEGIRPKKQSNGKQLWHCRQCCNEWISLRVDVIKGNEKSDPQT